MSSLSLIRLMLHMGVEPVYPYFTSSNAGLPMMSFSPSLITVQGTPTAPLALTSSKTASLSRYLRKSRRLDIELVMSTKVNSIPFSVKKSFTGPHCDQRGEP